MSSGAVCDSVVCLPCCSVCCAKACTFSLALVTSFLQRCSGNNELLVSVESVCRLQALMYCYQRLLAGKRQRVVSHILWQNVHALSQVASQHPGF